MMNLKRKLWIICGSVIVLNGILLVVLHNNPKPLLYIGDALPVICACISTILLWQTWRAFKRFDIVKISWLLIFTGILLNTIAEAVYGYLEVFMGMDMNTLIPSLADLFWCTAYLSLLAGLIMMFWGYKNSGLPMGGVMTHLILMTAFILLFSAVTTYLLIPIIQDPEISTREKVFYLFYPIADLFTVIPAAELMYLAYLSGSSSLSIHWRILAIGFLCFMFADLVYSFLNWKDLYHYGNPIDIFWNAGYLIIGMAGLYQKELVDKSNLKTTG
jgi:hypothetical protein